VKPPSFAYHRPRSLEEALDVLAGLGADGKVLAGGQSLVPLMSMRLAAPAALVDVNQVPGLAEVEVSADAVRVGALVRHSRLEHDEAAHDAVPLLRRAVRLVAHPTIRNRGTTVGSIVHADPCAEMPAVLCLLDGFVTVRSASGSRDVAAEEFFTGPMESDVRTGELAVSATFRRPAPGSRTAFVEVSRRHGDYAMCGVGAVVGDGAARVALIGVGQRPVVVALADAGDPEAVTGAVDAAIEPEDDVHASADYRRHLAHVLVRRAIDEAAA
jgi:aerobic carbon-monoxide dehydrogenase medium subunit